MSTTSADHRVETGRIARGRLSTGRPVWDEKIDLSDVFHDDALSFEEKRDAIVAKLCTSRWFRRADEFDAIRELVGELTDCEDVDHFDAIWDNLYDEADLGSHRVWITTF